MESRMDEFREFISRFPKIRDDVRSGKRTWQNIYEEWVLYGENDQQWLKYVDGEQNYTSSSNPRQQQMQQQSLGDSVKNIVSYIQKINPDSLNRTLNTVQKVVQIAQSFGSKSTIPTNYINSAYNDWWD
ncbi:MAG: spore coat protein YlbD [Bacilli bacterium]|nr:YlbD family protein [Bacilli bacterium]